MYQKNRRRPGMMLFGIGMIAGIVYFVTTPIPPVSVARQRLSPTAAPQVDVPTQVTALTAPFLPLPSPEVVLVIPNANVGAEVIEVFLDDRGSRDVSTLGGAVGHLQGTAALGESGNMVLAGHNELRDGSPGVFAYLHNLTVGDEILLTEASNSPWIYHVRTIAVVEPNDL